MSWAVGFDEHWGRDVGYGVPAICDHPDCKKKIDRGLSYVCGGDPYGGEHGCGLFFCEEHFHIVATSDSSKFVCERCAKNEQPFFPKHDTKEWIKWKLEDLSWKKWRDENPEKVEKMKNYLSK
ncbi:MAG TPA: hypothetical protein CFH81_08745 [Sulfurovum sp. UBA12169]|nr:MAG TPA: hypothetical protein CFH81_08745 [Sulfurovum sp. UBA12169]